MPIEQLVTLFVQGGIGAAALYVMWRVVAAFLSHTRMESERLEQTFERLQSTFLAGLTRIEEKWEQAVDRIYNAIRESRK